MQLLVHQEFYYKYLKEYYKDHKIVQTLLTLVNQLVMLHNLDNNKEDHNKEEIHPYKEDHNKEETNPNKVGHKKKETHQVHNKEEIKEDKVEIHLKDKIKVDKEEKD